MPDIFSLQDITSRHYFNGKLIMYGTGAIGSIFIISSVIVFLTDSKDASMYVLILSIFFISLLACGIKFFGDKWLLRENAVHASVHNLGFTSDEVHTEIRRPVAEEKPPAYSSAFMARQESPPPPFEVAIAMAHNG